MDISLDLCQYRLLKVASFYRDLDNDIGVKNSLLNICLLIVQQNLLKSHFEFYQGIKIDSYSYSKASKAIDIS